jgi:hypothetical protein
MLLKVREALISLLFLYASCRAQNSSKKNELPQEILVSITDSLNLDLTGKLHFGNIEITNGIAIIQTFDKKTRQQKMILVVDLKRKKQLGFFPWPDPQGGVHFGVAPYKDYLLYFNNYQFLRKINLATNEIDTIPVRSPISQLVRMVIINDKAYSLQNIYGINVVDINHPENQIWKKNYKGYYYNEQNNISLPIDDKLNLVASNETSPNTYVLYAIDSSMKIKWEKSLDIKDAMIQIASVRFNDRFVIKYDNKLDLVDAENGRLLRTHSFGQNITKMISDGPDNVILFLSGGNNEMIPLQEEKRIFGKIVSYNINKNEINWEAVNCGSDGSLEFLKGKYIYNACDSLSWIRTNLSDAESVRFKLQGSSGYFRIALDKYTGQSYLFFDNKLFW